MVGSKVVLLNLVIQSSLHPSLSAGVLFRDFPLLLWARVSVLVPGTLSVLVMLGRHCAINAVG